MAIRFTHHALGKIDLLARHGFKVSLDEVVETVEKPDFIEEESEPYIAQRRVDERHVLRVVFRREGDDIVIITFYPGRRERYEG